MNKKPERIKVKKIIGDCQVEVTITHIESTKGQKVIIPIEYRRDNKERFDKIILSILTSVSIITMFMIMFILFT